MATKLNSKIPTSGRIGRFASILGKETNRDVVEKVIKDADKYDSFNYAEKADWWNKAMQRLEKLVKKPTAVKVMGNCGRKCCGLTYRKRANQFMSESKSIGEFLDKLNKSWPAGVKFELKDENTIIQIYERCYCGQVKQTKESFPINTYCQCGVGWVKQLFESALGKSVKVDLKQSIICGGKSCEFIINI
jgi:hypothetical protein